METMEIIVSIAGILLGGTSIYTIIENIKYRKENKNLKTLEVEKANLETQDQKIDLGTKFQENTVKMMEELQKTYNATLKNGNDNSEILKKIDEINGRIDVLTSEVKEVKEEQKIQKIYLNGEYAAFRKIYLEMQAKDDNRKKKPASKKKKENRPQDNNSEKQE